MVLTYYLDGLQNYNVWREHHDHLKFLHSKGMATYTYGCTIKTRNILECRKQHCMHSWVINPLNRFNWSLSYEQTKLRYLLLVVL